MLTTLASYRMLAGDMSRSLARAAAAPDVERETAYYLQKIEGVGSVDAFMADDRLYRFAMKAFGLEDMTYAKAFMRKALEEGIATRDTFANKLTDTRYREFVETFNFAALGDTATVFERARSGVVEKYVRQTLEQDAGAKSEGTRLALYFERKAAEIESPYGILADTALLKVVQTALRIPAATGTMDIDRQAELIESRLDLADLKDPEKLDAFLARFAVLWDLDNGAPAASSPALALFQPREAGVGQGLLLSLQTLKLGGI